MLRFWHLLAWTEPDTLSKPAVPMPAERFVDFAADACCSYGAYLYFQLYTHSELFDESEDDDNPDAESSEPSEQCLLSTFTAISTLAVISLMVALHSE